MMTKHCRACGQPFTPCPQSKNQQQYCSDPSCQRARRRYAQAARRAASTFGRTVDAQYFKDWSAKHPGYWKQYRAGHLEYTERNRHQQRERNHARIAKDTSCSPTALPCGLYRLIPVDGGVIAKEAGWTVEIRILSGPEGFLTANCKMKP
jgi:hypothetical protein